MNTQKGAVLVEYAIYFPIVLCVVVAMIYLGLFHMQESALGHIAEQAVLEAAREEAYPGYHVFHMNSGKNPDFEWGENAPPESEVKKYYAEQHATFGDLYREAGEILQGIMRQLSGGSRSNYSENYSEKYAAATAGITLISAGTIQAPEITMQNGFFSSTVKVSIKHRFKVPGVFRYLGIAQENYTLETVAIKRVINPGEFVRNVDLADDMIQKVLEKFGVKDKVNDLMGKIGKVVDAILNPEF